MFICYANYISFLICQENPEVPAVVPMLGGNSVIHPYTFFKGAYPIRITEIYEVSMMSFQKKWAVSPMPQFQAFKIWYATYLIDLGCPGAATKYLDSVSKLAKAFPNDSYFIHGIFGEKLIQCTDRLTVCFPKLAAENLKTETNNTGWLNKISSNFTGAALGRGLESLMNSAVGVDNDHSQTKKPSSPLTPLFPVPGSAGGSIYHEPVIIPSSGVEHEELRQPEDNSMGQMAPSNTFDIQLQKPGDYNQSYDYSNPSLPLQAANDYGQSYDNNPSIPPTNDYGQSYDNDQSIPPTNDYGQSYDNDHSIQDYNYSNQTNSLGNTVQTNDDGQSYDNSHEPTETYGGYYQQLNNRVVESYPENLVECYLKNPPLSHSPEKSPSDTPSNQKQANHPPINTYADNMDEDLGFGNSGLGKKTVVENVTDTKLQKEPEVKKPEADVKVSDPKKLDGISHSFS